MNVFQVHTKSTTMIEVTLQHQVLTCLPLDNFRHLVNCATENPLHCSNCYVVRDCHTINHYVQWWPMHYWTAPATNTLKYHCYKKIKSWLSPFLSVIKEVTPCGQMCRTFTTVISKNVVQCGIRRFRIVPVQV